MKLMAALLCLVLILGCSAGAASAQEAKSDEVKKAEEQAMEKPAGDKVTGSAAVGFFSRYIFRGYELSKGSMVIQPSLSASYKGFSATFWGNMDTNAHDTQSYLPSSYGKEGRKWWNETDLTLSYTYAYGITSFTGGYIYYGTKYVEETEEFFLSFAWDVIGKPVVTFYQDITSYPGTYMNLALSHSVPLWKERGINLDLGGSVGYMSGQGKYWQTYEPATGGYTGSKYRAFHDGMVKAGLTIPVTREFVFQPLVLCWFPLSGDAKKHYGAASYNPTGYLDTVFVYGANFTLSF